MAVPSLQMGKVANRKNRMMESHEYRATPRQYPMLYNKRVVVLSRTRHFATLIPVLFRDYDQKYAFL